MMLVVLIFGMCGSVMLGLVRLSWVFSLEWFSLKVLILMRI